MKIFNWILETSKDQPFKQAYLVRFLALLVVLLSLLAGYFQVLYELENKEYKKLEDNYVRVRSQLGREETQRLIDQSYQEEL